MNARATGLWRLSLVALVMGLAVVPPAGASVDGPCTVLVQGKDLSESSSPKVQPDENDNLTYTIIAQSPVRRWTVTLHYGPFEREVLDRPFPAGATEETGHMSVADYTQYGTGLYEVRGRAELENGEVCTAIMTLEVRGSIFDSVLGMAAVAILGAAGLGILLTILQIVLDAKDVVEAAKDFIEQAKHTRAVVPPKQ